MPITDLEIYIEEESARRAAEAVSPLSDSIRSSSVFQLIATDLIGVTISKNTTISGIVEILEEAAKKKVALSMEAIVIQEITQNIPPD